LVLYTEIDKGLKIAEENVLHLVKMDAFSIIYKHLNLYMQNLVHYKKYKLIHSFNFFIDFYRETYDNFETITFEIHLKILIDLIYLMFVLGFKAKIIDYTYVETKLDWIEEVCLDLLNHSLQIPFIPAKKCVFLFGFYLNVLFENDPNKNEAKLQIYEKNMKYISENSINQMMKAPARFSLNLKNKVEKFYV